MTRAHPPLPPLRLPEQQQSLTTARLILRPLLLSDGPDVQRLAGHEAVAATTLAVPHPYLDGMAEDWIATHPAQYREGVAATWAIVASHSGPLVGCIGLMLHLPFHRAAIGYWIGVEHWGNGYCTEALKAVLDHGFRQLGLKRMFATHMAHNPASGRVMQRAGMMHEGVLRQHVVKWGEFYDVVYYGALRDEWLERQG